MPQLQQMVLQDRANPPVDHTFTPRNIVGGVGELVESQGVPVGEKRFTVSLRKTQNGRYKATLKLAIPVVAAKLVDGISTPTVVRTAYVEVNTDFAGTSSQEERADAIGLMTSALASDNTMINSVVTDLEGIY
nr:MAG: coat protein [Leviviridae sp.]